MERIIPLDGVYNVRDLGGFVTADETAYGQFYRGDSPANLSGKDIQTLKDFGITLVIDLRSPQETEKNPSKLKDVEGISVVHIPMFDRVQSADMETAFPASMGELYRSLLDTCMDSFHEIGTLFAQQQGASLFHCTAGKDRTGVVAMLLLDLAGIPADQITASYAQSERNLQKTLDQQKKQIAKLGLNPPDYVFRSLPKDMDETIKYLHTRYQGAEKYFLKCGLSELELQTILDKFVR